MTEGLLKAVTDPDQAIGEARRLLESAESTLVLTGAGVSAESSVPTFRGPDGLWKSHRPEQLATPKRSGKIPASSGSGTDGAGSGWLRAARMRPTKPWPVLRYGTHALESRPRTSTACTSWLSRWWWLGAAQIPRHEGRSRWSSMAPSSGFAASHVGSELDIGARLTPPARIPFPAAPNATACLLRPDVVWFGESLEPMTLDAAVTAAESAEVCLVVGTSAVVHPAASLPLLTHRAGGVVVEVNPAPTPLSGVAQMSFRAPAADIVPRLLVS